MARPLTPVLIMICVGISLQVRPTAASDPSHRATGKVLFLKGKVTVNGKPAAVGQVILKDDEIEAAKDGRLIVRLPNAAVQVGEKTKIKILELQAALAKVRLKVGSLLSAVIPRTSYEVNTPIAVAAVRGTTFFLDVPRGTETYACVCRGTVEFRDLLTELPKQTVTATHHKAIQITQRNNVNLYQSAAMLKHTDAEAAAVESYLAP